MAPPPGDAPMPPGNHSLQAQAPARPISPLLQQGLKFLEAGDGAGADLLLETYLLRSPDDADGHNLAGLAKRHLGQLEAAVEHLRTAASLNLREPLYAVNLAMLLGELGRADQAIVVLDNFLTAVPGQADGLIQRAALLRRLNRFDEAVASARMAVAFHRDFARAHNALGLALMKVNAFAEAVTAFGEALRLDQGVVETWINRGVAHKETGDLLNAEADYRRALNLAPNDSVIHNNLANTLLAAGRDEAAVEHYRLAVALDPGYADAKANLGLALRDTGDLPAALKHLTDAVAQHPEHAGLLNACGNTLRQAERFDEAIAVLHQAVEAAPGYAEAHNNLGLAYAVRNRLEPAERHFRRACELRPDMAVISNNYGAVLLRLFRFDAAVAALSNAVARQADYEEAMVNLGVAHYMLGQSSEAIATYLRVLERNPNNGFARYSLGVTYLEDQRLAEAEVEIRRALELDPSNAMALNTLGVLLLDQRHVSEARAAMRVAADVNTLSAPVFYSNYAFASLYEPDVSNAEILEIHKEYGRRYAASEVNLAKAHAHIRDPGRRLRLGYMSPDLRAHSVAYFFEALLEKHDRGRFEIVLYSDTTRTDAVTKAMRAAAGLWVETAGLTNDVFAQRIVDDRIDILINLGGHTSGNRLPVAAVKPAPVQIEYLGYPETSGVPAMDYRISDGRADPDGEADRWCTEKIIRLPHGFHCYRPAGTPPPPAPAPHIARGYVTYASFNVLPKVTDRAIAAWAEILKAVPNARFFMKCKQLRDVQVQAKIRGEFARHGIDQARIGMGAFVPSVREHLECYGDVDLALDTFPYNGTTTTCESLYMGVPVLTLRGHNHRGRVGLSLLSAMGLDGEFVADGVDDYIARAVAWGREPSKLAEIRQALRPRMGKSPLRDEVGFTRNLEAVYRDAWRKWCAGPPTYMFKSPPELRPEDSIQGVLVKTL
ncbi:MAG: tetratricopeptide repeat protein [Rhodospirillaceae bacterium]|nr:tetratricopeptide repeat protein [Rhodospirillaceae bacterium]